MEDLIRDFLGKTVSAYGESASDTVRRALEWSTARHGELLRASGEPAIMHNIRVARTLVEMGMDMESVLAALFHDIFEESPATARPGAQAVRGSESVLKEISERFSPGTAFIVDGVSRIAAVRAKNKTVHAAETMRKMLFAMTRDLRVIIVKLADKLDSMRTLKWLPEERQKQIATECLDVFAPLADRLGISWLKDELEDLSLKVINREAFDQIKDIVAIKRGEREEFLARVQAEIMAEAKKEGIAVEISARAKHFYSIYLKMRKKAKGAEELYDLLGLRLICDTEYDCYALLGLVHRLWKPMDGRFKDYIAMPKANGYRSLHTTVMCYGGTLLEVQIRTGLMHRVAEYGVASHWLYKGGSSAEAPRIDDLPIVSKLKEWNGFLAEGAEYLETIKRELLKDSIFVFTPVGDVIELPSGSTPLDFAFAIHSDVGIHCLGAKADGAIIPLDGELKNTQVVEILTSPQARPNVNWLRIARTSKARSKIRAVLVASGQVLAIDKSIIAGKKAEKEKAEEHGRAAHEGEEQKAGGTSLQFTRDSAALAAAQAKGTAPKPPSTVEFRAYEPGQVLRNDKAGVAIGGAKNMMIRIAGCCRPVTGDRIVGYVSRGRGIIVHREDCKSLAAIADFADRRIEVAWEQDAPFVTARYRVTVRRTVDIFSEMEAAVHKFRGRLREGKLDEQGDGTLSGYFTMEVDSRDDVKRIAKALRGLPTVLGLEEE